MEVPSEGGPPLTTFLRRPPLGDDVPKRVPKASASTPEPKKAPRVPRRKQRAQVRHGTRDFVLKVLEGTVSGPAIGTMAIIKQVRKLAGKRLPEETIRSSLKTLVRQRLAKGRKRGHEKTYKLVQATETAAAPRALPTRPETLPGGPAPPAAPSAADLATRSFPHKLAVGEILVLSHEKDHLLVAANVHGRLEVQKHQLPRK